MGTEWVSAFTGKQATIGDDGDLYLLKEDGAVAYVAYDKDTDSWPTEVSVEGNFDYIDSGDDYLVGVTRWGDIYYQIPSDEQSWVQITGHLK